MSSKDEQQRQWRTRDNQPHQRRRDEVTRQQGRTSVPSERGTSKTQERRYRFAAVVGAGLISVAAALLPVSTGSALAREGNAPLTHYHGCHRMVTTDAGSTDWECDAPDESGSSTVGDGAWIEMRFPGWCTDPATGVRKTARPFHRVTCGK